MGKILIVGATGYIGAKLFRQAQKKFATSGTSSQEESEYIRLSLEVPNNFPYKEAIEEDDVIIITAAISAPDMCANDHQHAWAVNVSGTASFIRNVINRGARVIFFSSDTIYGEQDKFFDESCVLKPAGEYAEMKFEIERIFQGNPSFKSVRLSYVFSSEDKFTKYLIGCMKKNEEAEIFHPFYRAIIHRDDVVDGVIALVEKWDEIAQTAINFGGPEIISRIRFKEIFNKNFMDKLNSRVTEPPPTFFLNRPRIIAMQSPVLKSLLGRSPRNLAEAMTIEFSKENIYEF